MKFIIFIVALFFITADVSAQLYRTFLTYDMPIYEGPEVVPVAIDSFEVVGNDTIFYFYRHVRLQSGLPGGCTFTTEGAAWTGTKMIKRANEEVFFNKNGDSIIFAVNNVFDYSRIDTIFKFSSGNVITSRLTGEGTEVVLDEMDYKKDITLKVLDPSGNEVNHPLNNFVIVSGNRYGFTKTLNFYNFPDDNTPYYLTGWAGAQRGKTNVVTDSIFHIEKGHEFHYEVYHSFCGFAGCRIENIKEKRFVLDKQISPNQDTLLFIYQRAFINEIDDPVAGMYTEMGVDTISEKVILSEHRFLDSLNREYFIWNNSYWNDPAGYAVENNPDSTGPRYRKELFLGYDYDQINNCLIPRSGSFPKIIYGNGLGVTYSNIDSGGVDQHIRNLVYYQKGVETWGTPLDFSPIGIDEIDNSLVKIYPNPATDQLTIELPSEIYDVTIFDMAGKIVFNQKSASTIKVNLSRLNSGIYLIKLSCAGKVENFKLVKH